MAGFSEKVFLSEPIRKLTPESVSQLDWAPTRLSVPRHMTGHFLAECREGFRLKSHTFMTSTRDKNQKISIDPGTGTEVVRTC